MFVSYRSVLNCKRFTYKSLCVRWLNQMRTDRTMFTPWCGAPCGNDASCYAFHGQLTLTTRANRIQATNIAWIVITWEKKIKMKKTTFDSTALKMLAMLPQMYLMFVCDACVYVLLRCCCLFDVVAEEGSNEMRLSFIMLHTIRYNLYTK